MAFGTPVVGTTAYSASAGTSVAPSYPSGVLATDQLVMFVGMKPSTANGGTLTAPSGWTIRDSLTGAGGYGTTIGADVGNTNLWVLTKDTVTAGLSGTVTTTIGTNNVSWAFIVRVPTSGGTISYGFADGQRTTTPTSPMDIGLTNGTSATNFTAGDIALWAMCIPTDVTTPSQFSAQSITATGVTFNTAVELNEPDNTTGNDIGGYSAYATVASGSSTTAPTVTSTLAGTLTNVRGPVVLLRINEAAPPARTGDMDATETGTDAFSSSGDVLVEGSLAVSEVGTDTFASSGVVLAATITGTLTATEIGSDVFSSSGDVFVRGSLASTETGTDTFTASGQLTTNTATGSLAAIEVSDVIAVNGAVIIKGVAGAFEGALDTFEAIQGYTSITGSMTAVESGGGSVAFGINAVMKYYNGTAWQVLYKDPTVYT